jgi:hypothetical protein
MSPAKARRVPAYHYFAAAVVAFWLIMMGLLYDRHTSRPRAVPLAASYDRLLPPDVQKVQRTMGIYLLERRFGTAHTVIRRMQDEILVSNVIEIQAERIPKFVRPIERNVVISFDLVFSPLTGLRQVKARVPEFEVNLIGLVQGDELVLTGRIGTERVREVLPFAQNRLLSDFFSPLEGLPRLGPSDVGRKWEVTLMNPFTGRSEHVLIEIKRLVREKIGGRDVPIYILEFNSQNSLWNTWVTEEGEVLQQGTPFGLVLKREDVPFLSREEAPPQPGADAFPE